MSSHILSDSTQVTILLSGRFAGEDEGTRPLTTTEFNRFATWMEGVGLTPFDMLDADSSRLTGKLDSSGFDAERVTRLLARGTSMAISVEQWTNIGLWIVGRDDSEYPTVLKSRLGSAAPPLLYGAGERKLLNKGGVAIVGSRNADESALLFARSTATACAREETQVVSGAARGVDSEAMLAALENGGTVLGVLAENLEREMVSGKARDWISSRRLTLISPFHPRAVFNVGNAMERNKLIYTLANFAVVVSAEKDKGGTWSGALENLKHNWVPLFVRDDAEAPDGNPGLIRRGGIALEAGIPQSVESFSEWMKQHRADAVIAPKASRKNRGGSKQQSLL
jgi:predicted Rossmann fold nucleotide-binding protein DprA/Smf involved in DNA uptake